MNNNTAPEAIFLRAKALFYSGNATAAITQIQNALSLDPDCNEYSRELKVHFLQLKYSRKSKLLKTKRN
jgi:hypothetical protein